MDGERERERDRESGDSMHSAWLDAAAAAADDDDDDDHDDHVSRSFVLTGSLA